MRWHHGRSKRARTDGIQALLATARGPNRGRECTGMPVSHERVHQRMRAGQSRRRKRRVAIVVIMVAVIVVIVVLLSCRSRSCSRGHGRIVALHGSSGSCESCGMAWLSSSCCHYGGCVIVVTAAEVIVIMSHHCGHCSCVVRT